MKLTQGAQIIHRSTNGYSLAYANLYLLLAGLISRFELELVDTTERDVTIVRDQFVSKPTRKSTGVKVRVVREKKAWNVW